MGEFVSQVLDTISEWIRYIVYQRFGKLLYLEFVSDSEEC